MSEFNNEYNKPEKTEGEFVEDFAAEQEAKDTDPKFVQNGEKLTPEALGAAALKFAQETAFAAAGLADVLAKKAKELYETQRKQLNEKTPEGVDPNFRQFVDTMPDQFKQIIDEATKAYKEMAEKGRHVVTDLETKVQTVRSEREAKLGHGAFDIKEDAEASKDSENVVAAEDTVDVDSKDDWKN